MTAINLKIINDLVEAIHATLKVLNKTVSTAESCTSGGIAANLTKFSGASSFMRGGVVAYCNEIKEKLLGVNHETIEKCDVVSSEVVTEMANGILDLTNSDYAIATSGYIDGGGNDNVPNGTVWIACGNREHIKTVKLNCSSDRETNTNLAITKALSEFLAFIKEDEVNLTCR